MKVYLVWSHYDEVDSIWADKNNAEHRSEELSADIFDQVGDAQEIWITEMEVQ